MGNQSIIKNFRRIFVQGSSSSSSSSTKIEELFTNIDGSATTSLAHTPLSSSLLLFNGSGQRLTNTIDYTISGLTITWLFTFQSTNIIANYEY